MSSQDSNDYWEQLERLEKLIKASELKAGVIFSFHGIILGLFIDRFDQLKPLFLESTLYLILGVVWMCCIICSIFYCFKCFKPRIELKYGTNVFFYRDAIHAFENLEAYVDELQKVIKDKNKFYKQLGEQIYAESKIIDQKFRSVQNALKFFGMSFIIVLVYMIVRVILMLSA